MWGRLLQVRGVHDASGSFRYLPYLGVGHLVIADGIDDQLLSC
jgi:hypothetical protein